MIQVIHTTINIYTNLKLTVVTQLLQTPYVHKTR